MWLIDRKLNNQCFLHGWTATRGVSWKGNLHIWNIPQSLYWIEKKCEWHKRQKEFYLGRLHHVPPDAGEYHYLGLLLPHTIGATFHEDIRTINEIVYPTFKDVCYSLGLLSDDREYVDGILEASYWASAHYMRNLFAILLMMSSMTSPEVIFNKTWKCLSDDILQRQRRIVNLTDLRLTDEQLKNYSLVKTEKLLQQNGSTLKRLQTMSFPDQTTSSEGHNSLIQKELNYDRSILEIEHESLFSKLTAEQKGVYEEILEAVWSDMGGMFFLYGFGGIGKTFIWSVLSAIVRLHGHIIFNVASSGITSLLLPGGRTTHSRFAIPININETSTCHIIHGSDLSALISKAKLIIWDEAPMINRHSFEALDRSLRDIIRCSDGSPSNLPFGGKTIVLGGDFRQILPVIPKGSREDIVYSTINSSHLWRFCKVLRLTKNMRLQNASSDMNITSEEIVKFSNWILKVGDGVIGESDDDFAVVEIPEDNLIFALNDPIDAIVNNIYPSITDHFRNDRYFEDKVILAPTHKVVESINDKVLDLIPGDAVEYLRSNKVCSGEDKSSANEELYSIDYLNSIRCSGLPNHRLFLKIGVPIMLLRSIDQKAGLCNGTRLITTKLEKHIIEAKIISAGRNVGNKVYIPRMILSTSDQTSPVKFLRRQFPILLCFAMTINKRQGQSLSTVGVYLPKPVFTHGQLYVVVSRVKSKRGLKILCLDDEGKSCNYTTNVVYKEVFRNL